MFAVPPAPRGPSLAQMLQAAVQKDGEKRFGKAFKCMLKSASDDPRMIDVAAQFPIGQIMYGVIHRLSPICHPLDFIPALLNDLASKFPLPAPSRHDLDMRERLELSLSLA